MGNFFENLRKKRDAKREKAKQEVLMEQESICASRDIKRLKSFMFASHHHVDQDKILEFLKTCKIEEICQIAYYLDKPHVVKLVDFISTNMKFEDNLYATSLIAFDITPCIRRVLKQNLVFYSCKMMNLTTDKLILDEIERQILESGTVTQLLQLDACRNTISREKILKLCEKRGTLAETIKVSNDYSDRDYTYNRICAINTAKAYMDYARVCVSRREDCGKKLLETKDAGYCLMFMDYYGPNNVVPFLKVIAEYGTTEQCLNVAPRCGKNYEIFDARLRKERPDLFKRSLHKNNGKKDEETFNN